MLYHITGIQTFLEMHGFSFCIKLYPKWKECITKSGLKQENINRMINLRGREWLDGCGYGDVFDHDKTRKMYTPDYDLRVAWGEWGPEHMSIPGINAAGLDIDDVIDASRRGRCLYPHNVDTMGQAYLLITVFSKIADYIVGGLEQELFTKPAEKETV